jgi:hypothetical protein
MKLIFNFRGAKKTVSAVTVYGVVFSWNNSNYVKCREDENVP